MGIAAAIILILGGVLAAANFIIGQKPEAKPTIDAIAPYQGYIGVILFIWGIVFTIHLVTILGILSSFPILLVTFVLITLLCLGLGALLGYGLITRYTIAGNEEAMKKAEEIKAQLVSVQVPMGFAGIAVGLWGLIAPFVFAVA